MSRKTIAAVIADTDCHTLAFNALHQSVSRFDVQQVIIFSDKPEAWPGYSVIKIDPIKSVEDYNYLVTKRLAEELRCDYALIMQFDGFILNPQEWAPLFFHYDYIGAPWPGSGSFMVGNGGFSLRSRRLVEEVAALDYLDLSAQEDIFICRSMGAVLNAKGVRFAPKEIASHFSVELSAVSWPTFGFHGVFHLPEVYRLDHKFLIENLSSRVLRSRWKNLLPGFQKISNAAEQDFLLRVGGLLD